MIKMSQPAQDTVLFVFDFDSTTVAETADVWVMEWMPRLRDLFRLEWEHADCWHTFARRIPEVLYEKGYTESDLRERLAGMSFLGGMSNVFKKIGEHSSTELIVASDANVAYISCFLESKGLLQAVDHIHSNPAEFDDKGKLIISPYHKHSCERCKEAPNMCKGKIMREILKEKSYNKVVYVGDGGNDICPTLELSSKDHVVAREDYALAAGLNGALKKQVKASIHIMDFNHPETESLLLSFLPKIK